MLIVFFSTSLISVERLVAEDKCEYYSDKFKKIQEKFDKKHKDGLFGILGKEVDGLKNLVVSLREDVSGISQGAVWDTKASEDFKKYTNDYSAASSAYNDCSRNFRQVSYEYNGWKNEKVDPTDEESSEINKDKYREKVSEIDIIQNNIEKELSNYKNEIAKSFSILSENMLGVVHTTQLLDFVADFCVLGGSIWMILGTITLAGSLKDKNGPTLQTSIWQIVGGTMIVFATYLFKNSSQYPNLLNEVLRLASQFTRVGGALWSAWGVIILAGAIKDKTGPALQSAIWQIVGGIMIIMTSYLFTYVVKVM